MIRINEKYQTERGTFIITSHAPHPSEVSNYGAKRTYLVHEVSGNFDLFIGRYFNLKQAREKVLSY